MTQLLLISLFGYPPPLFFLTMATQVTQGTLGVIEYVLSCGLGGMAYAVLSGQPMTFIGPTGLTLAFMTALYRCVHVHVCVCVFVSF